MKNITKRIGLAVAVLRLAVGITGQSRAGIILDTYGAGQDATSLSSGDGLGATITVGPTDTLITNIEVYTSIRTDSMIIDFLIFDHQTGSLLLSQAKGFAADPGDVFSYKKSDDFSFNLIAGKTYDIGATYTWTGGNGYLVGLDFTGNTQNGLSSTIPSSEFFWTY